jgi:16S rRNA (cytosine1402-N4)-methyltransferase
MHIPVLLKETLSILQPEKDKNYIDATFGEGNLSFEIVKLIKPKGKVLAFEWDPELYKLGLEKIKKMKEKNIKLVNKNFKEIKKVVKKEKFYEIKGIVFDLGISRWHYESSGRGFSFKKEEPLDMRINPKEIKITAFDIVNYASYYDLVKIFKEYGNEKEAEIISKAILERRKIKKIETSKELGEIVSQAKKEKTKIHPATKVFMALRVFINQELENLNLALEDSLEVLEKGGKIVIITFQGFEDKVVKKFIKKYKKEGKIEVLTKNVIKPKEEEKKLNPSARSAKLRAIKKI